VDPDQKISIFPFKFPKISIFSDNFTEKSIFPGKFPKKVDFSGNSKKISNFQAKIGHLGLQLFLGKLFYFSSKVTTFEHISCT